MRRLHIVVPLCLLAPLAATADPGLPKWLFKLFMEQTEFIGRLNQYIGKLAELGKVDKRIAERASVRVMQEAVEPATMDVYHALDRAEQPVVQEILSRPQKITNTDEIENLIKDVLKKQSHELKQEIDPLSLKIKIGKTYDIGTSQIALGSEFDVGKYISSSLAGGIIGCAQLADKNYVECIRTAYQKFVEQATTGAHKQMESELEDKLTQAGQL